MSLPEEDILLEDGNRLLKASYENENYKVIHGVSDNKICVVFFSGNALYYPNTEECFRTTILYRDRYEWSRVSSVLLEKVSKIIQVRDIRKSWYVDGISSKYDTVDKLLEKLKDLCKGYEVYTVGNSAGGYMALLAGMKLCAGRIYNWGGQVDLWDDEERMHQSVFLERAKDDPYKNRYFSLIDLLKKNETPVYSFYSKNNKLDMKSIDKIKGMPFSYLFEMESDQHGQGFRTDTYINLIQIQEEKLTGLAGDCNGIKISPDDLGKRINELTDDSVRYRMKTEEDSAFLRIRKKLGKIKRGLMNHAK